MSHTQDYAFVHGGGQGGWVWEDTLAALRQQTGGTFGRALALDAPGCGAKRGRPTAGLKMEDVARELLEDIERAGLKDVVLVGHSQAGQTLPLMTKLRPDLFSRQIYVTCSAPLPSQNVQQMLGKGLHDSNENEVGWPLDPAISSADERYRLMFCNDMSPAQADAFLSRLGHDQWPALTYSESGWDYGHMGDRAGAVPASYVICLRDMALPAAWQEKFADRLQVQRRVRIDAGHQVMNSRPQALAEVLLIEASSAA
jgi:pimeloyl-ACP methyl ester carboxylesterase